MSADLIEFCILLHFWLDLTELTDHLFEDLQFIFCFQPEIFLRITCQIFDRKKNV